MTTTRLLITAVVVENRPVPEVASAYGVSRSWLYELLARYRREGEAVFEPRSRRPASNPNAIPTEALELIVELREKLTATGLDAGPDTIRWHLQHHQGLTISRATIARHLARAGLVVPEPKKRPKSSYIRFQAEQPNECWQSDFTHHRLTRPDGRPGPDTEILTWLDDHSRYALSVTAHHRVTGPIVLATFRQTVAVHGIPAATLTDNGMVFTTRLSGGARGAGTRNGFETELRRHGVLQKNGKPNHPQTQGKVERFQQTMKKWLRAQPEQPATIAELQAHLDTFAQEYNEHRPHRSLEHRATPATAYTTRPKATPGAGHREDDTHDRVRRDKVDKVGKITLRHGGTLYSIGIGRTHAGTRVIVLAHDLDIRIIDAATGELLRELVLDTTKRYQGTGRPPGRPRH
ncbi:IS481 family transposase [Intrasporangium calvum]|uniref:Integrase catalytic region n=1 Tax=Intrasporangium calvum (strain ATCC 23552 / DSM 43043 / JCM 3097 / NBRC 12989 / NCIMB 10167 / NRRL B-3866 / 7 KIP) TaxID=710696 RepID=E6S8I4_INTC7|nr:IS481 family transposase [Intrasporangium calvum]ADU49146.1 Integrase catalytic region [Intrasporangium calvum DSM 43043]